MKAQTAAPHRSGHVPSQDDVILLVHGTGHLFVRLPLVIADGVIIQLGRIPRIGDRKPKAGQKRCRLFVGQPQLTMAFALGARQHPQGTLRHRGQRTRLCCAGRDRGIQFLQLADELQHLRPARASPFM